MEPFIGMITCFGGNFAPRGWAFCDGQLLDISTHAALFSILGTTYGGNGTTTFALPDLRGRMPLHPGTGPGLTQRDLGERGGAETVTLTTQQMPSHTHAVNCQAAQGTLGTPKDNFLAADRAGADDVYSNAADAVMNAAANGNTGGGQAHQNMSPFIGINFLIALEGVYPSRS